MTIQTFFKAPDLGGAALVSISASTMVDDSMLSSLTLEEEDLRTVGSAGSIATIGGRSFGLQQRFRSYLAEDGTSRLAIELLAWEVDRSHEEYDKSNGRLAEVFSSLSLRVDKVVWRVRAHAHRPLDSRRPIVQLPLPVPVSATQRFSEISGVTLVRRLGNSADAKVEYEVEIGRGEDEYHIDCSFEVYEPLRADLAGAIVARAQEIVDYAFLD